MANLIAIVGESGAGKSRSIKTLNPEETILINVAGKPFPFKGWKNLYSADKTIKDGGNYLNTRSSSTIQKALNYINDNRPEIKTIVIDDYQYLMSFEYMRRAMEKGYDKFTEIALNAFAPIELCVNLRDDLTVIFINHEDTVSENFKPKRKMKTIGKMLDNAITMEGLFTIVLFAEVRENADGKKEYGFVTNSDGITTAKSPEGMFDNEFIPNDLKMIIQTVNQYYNE